MQEKLFTHIFVCMLYYYSYILVLTILSSNSSQIRLSNVLIVYK